MYPVLVGVGSEISCSIVYPFDGGVTLPPFASKVIVYGVAVHFALIVASPAPQVKVEVPVDGGSVPAPAVFSQPPNVYPVFSGAVIVTVEP